MKPHYAISIPKPCHENWDEMTPNEKGRFCNSCSKTVIDFTKMDTSEIQNILKNSTNNICGRLRQEQLDTINLSLPSQILEQHYSFHKLFLLALLIIMGTTLLNCTNKNGQKKRINSVEVVDSLEHPTSVTLESLVNPKNDSINNVKCTTNNDPFKDDGHKPNDVLIIGEMIEVKGSIAFEPMENVPITYFNVENPPEFKNTPQNLTAKEKKEYFSSNLTKFVLDNFNFETTSHLRILGYQRIIAQFKIDSLGFVKDIKTRAIHPILEQEAKRVISLLPGFIPAKNNGENVSIIYNLPIAFKLED